MRENMWFLVFCMMGFLKIGSRELFAWAGIKSWSSFIVRMTGMSHQHLAYWDLWTSEFCNLYSCEHSRVFSSGISFFFFLVLLPFRLRASPLLGRHCTTWTTPSALDGHLEFNKFIQEICQDTLHFGGAMMSEVGWQYMGFRVTRAGLNFWSCFWDFLWVSEPLYTGSV
jgi:hypothetical protein